MSLESIKVLETKVDDVLNRQVALGEERKRLQQELGEARAEIEVMADQMADIERERTEIKQRVERLLARLQDLNLA
jgi:chromosome segregation ATPase